MGRPKTTEGPTSATTVHVETKIRDSMSFTKRVKDHGSISAYVNSLIKRDLKRAGE